METTLHTRVLLVSDREALGDELTQGLAVSNIAVVRRVSLLGLYAALIRELPDVLVIDATLPRIALEATARFLQTKGIRDQYPIVVLAAGAVDDSDPASIALALHATDLVPGGAPMVKIARSIAKAAGRHALAAAARSPTPVPSVPSAAPPPAQEEITGELRVGRSADILVVDDDPALTRLLRRILETRYVVHVENNGRAAMEACERWRFRAVFCDLHMPDLSGAEVYRTLLRTQPALAARFVFVTGAELDETEAEFFMGLTNQLVRKPFTMRDILAAATKALG